MKKALAIVAYARFDYFERVFESILIQEIRSRSVLETYDIHVFQDGLWDGESEENRMGHARIASRLSEVDPRIQVTRQTENLSIARHFDAIERHLFITRGYDLVTFFEDDMVLAPGYMATMDAMSERFRGDPRIGMFSANPGDTTCPIATQRARRGDYTTMGHNWGFGVFRPFWLQRQRLVDQYMKWANAFDYRKRPTREISSWLESMGFKPLAASQDYMKQCATTALGAVRVASFPNFGLPIGRIGLHCKPETFRAMGFDRTVLFDGPLDTSPELDDPTFHRILAAQSIGLLSDPATFDTARWTEQLARGAFDPDARIERVLAKRRPASLSTEADVIACYRLLLGRPPENDDVIQSRVNRSLAGLLEAFLRSDEFSRRTQFADLFADVALRLDGRSPGSKGPDRSVADNEEHASALARIAHLERKIGQLTIDIDELRQGGEVCANGSTTTSAEPSALFEPGIRLPTETVACLAARG